MRVAPQPEPRLRLPPKHEDVIPCLMRVERTGSGVGVGNKSLQALVAGSEPGSPGPALFMAHLSSSCPGRRHSPLREAPFPCRDERQRALL